MCHLSGDTLFDVAKMSAAVVSSDNHTDLTQESVVDVNVQSYCVHRSALPSNVKCVNVFANDVDLESPSNLKSLECDSIYVTITKHRTTSDAIDLVKRWTSTIPNFSGKRVGFSIPAKMLMEIEDDWFDVFDLCYIDVGGLADDDDEVDTGFIDL